MKRCLAVLLACVGLVATLPDVSESYESHTNVIRIAPEAAYSPPELRVGSRGDYVRLAQSRLNALATNVCNTHPDSDYPVGGTHCLTSYRIVVDGVFGPQTKEAVQMFQSQQLLRRDGIIGPKTWARLSAPLEPCAAAEKALRAAGATPSELTFTVKISRRESGCHLAQMVDRPSTGDYSWGPFGLNYSKHCCGDREGRFGPPWVNIVSWERAAENMLDLGRRSGWCHFDGPHYCKGK